jgi:hypothetical protein
MCGAVPTTTDEWERCRVKRLCENDVHCSAASPARRA